MPDQGVRCHRYFPLKNEDGLHRETRKPDGEERRKERQKVGSCTAKSALVRSGNERLIHRGFVANRSVEKTEVVGFDCAGWWRVGVATAVVGEAKVGGAGGGGEVVGVGCLAAGSGRAGHASNGKLGSLGRSGEHCRRA